MFCLYLIYFEARYLVNFRRFYGILVYVHACLLRYNGLSGIYLLCLLFIPLLPSPGGTSSKSPIILQCVIFCISILFTFTQVIFQVVMVADQPYGHFFNQCSSFGIAANQIGFNRYDKSDVTDIIRLLAPDVIVFLISMFSVLSCRNLTPYPSRQHIDGSFPDEEILYRQCYATPLEEIVPLCVAVAMLLGGITQPNVFSAVYFLTFLLLGICWAFHLNDYIQKSSMYTFIRILLTCYAGLHVILLYLYQFPFFQDVLNPEDFKSRLLGLTAIINNTDCARSTEMIIVQTLPWPFYIYPFMIFILYCCLAVENRLRFQKDENASIHDKVSYPWWHPVSWRKTEKKEISPLLDNTPSGSQFGSQYGSQYGAVETVGSDVETVIRPKEETVEPIHIQSTFSSIVMFVTRQSYIAALITMMAWSITYHSWLTFVLLLWACISWATPFARRFCMLSSPYLVIYADLLLIIQYLYGMNLKDSELPVSDGSFNFSELGMIRWKYPVINLGAQTLFTWVFLVTLRQHLREKKMNRRKVNSPNGAVVLTTIARPVIAAFKKRVRYSSSKRKVDKIEEVEQGMSPSDDAKEFMAWMKSTLSKYWILFCCFAFLLVALQNEVSLYQIFYMVIFLMVFIIYQFSVWVWKAVLRPLWWFMVIYSIVILLTIYTFQFENMPQYWMNGTHLSAQWLYDIGLRQQSKTSLLLELLVPTLFSIVIVIQLHFFHKPLMMKINRLLRHRKERQKEAKRRSLGELSSTVNTSDDNLPSTSNAASSVNTEGTESTSDELDSETSNNNLAKLRVMYVKTSVILWRFAEIHISKCIYFVTILVVVQQISVINGVFMVLVALAMPSLHLQKFIDYILIVWSSITVLVFMFYQLKFVDEELLDINCTALTNRTFPTPAPNSHFVNNAWWVGFHKVEAVRSDVRGYLFIVIFVVLKKVIKHHQELYRYRKNLEIPRQGVLFDDVTRKMADERLSSCLKYLCNNFFNLFGIEINLMVIVLSMSIRSDAIAVLHSLWVALFLSFRRKNLYKIWPFYVGYMAVLLPLQYVFILGWPPGLCKGYPWDDLDPHSIVQWFYLTDVENPQDQYLLFAEYFQFLVACCQANSFANDATLFKNNSSSSSSSSVPDAEERYTPPDFMHNKTWLDFMKIVFLDQFLWVSLTIVYITAQSTTSLFNSGFIVGCFFFLWHGQGMYLRPRAQIKKWWKTLITYNFFVIVAKVWLQLVSCVFITSIYNKTDCYLIQLLNLYCTRKKVYHIENHPMNKEQCINEGDTGLIMDSVCFMVILIQYRIFHSPYFKYVVRDHRRQSDMASRGAQLVEQRLQIRLANSKQSDAENMARIKKKVMKARQKLKALQQQVNPTATQPTSHYEAIYSGDSYLFEDSETDSDSDSKDGVESADVSIFLLPKATSEQQESGMFPPDGTTQQFHHTEDSQKPENLVIVSSGEPTAKDESVQTDGIRHRHSMKQPAPPPPQDSLTATQGYSCESQDETFVTASYEANTSSTFRVKVEESVDAIRKVFYDFAQSATRFFNNSSADYRSITTQLATERKEQSRTHLHTNFTPSVADNEEKINILEGSSTGSSKMEEDTDTWAMIDTVEENDETWKKDHCAVSCAVAFYYALLANTDWLCYALMIINHMYYASVLSAPLPFFVFLWGLLSIPRPTKRFWIAVITYVELVIVVKYILQFQFPTKNSFNECKFYGPKSESNPLCPPRIIGIERLRDSSVCDLVLLLGLFFHRYSLKIHGLWREKSYFDEEEMTPCPSQATGSVADHTNSLKGGDVGDITGTTTSSPYQQESSKGSPLKAQVSFQKKSMLQNMKNFVTRIHNPEVGTGAVDVYAWMFCAQFIIFCIILFSWSSFSSNSSQESNSNFAKIMEGDAVPQTFLYLLLTWFFVIVFDRCLYMKKTVLAKLVYNAVLTFVVHAFLFIYVPALTQRGFTENIPAMLMYIFLCIYFMLSSYQVRCGYPTRILGNFLTKNYTIVSGILFQGIQAIPFLLELRSVLDWVLTKTTMTLSHWLKMEDIYANVFVIKCWRDSEKTWPHKRGEAYWKSSKWMIGGILVTLLVVVIWFPLLLMSFIKTAYISNRPVEVTFTLTLGGYQPLFKVTTQQQFLKELSSREISQIINAYDDENPLWDSNKVDEALRGYKKRGTLMSIKILSNSSAIWTISPPSRDVLIQDLESNSSISLRFKYVFSREQNTTQAAIVQETVSGVQTTPLHAGDPIRKEMVKVLRSPSGDGEVKLPNLFPTFIQVPASGPVKRVQWLGGGNMVNCTIVLRRGSVPNLNSTEVEWWEIIQDSPLPIFSHGPGYLEIIALSDLVPPLHLSFFASKGIIGLYVGFVWLVGKFVRLFFTSISYRIMFDEMPNVNRILKLCLEIYMARESKELELEEDLFAKLLYLYRSPETLIKWTKYKRLKTS